MQIVLDDHQPSIHVVVAFGGRYDEAWESNQIACFDEEVAKAYIVDKEEKAAAFLVKYKKYEALLDAERDAYVLANPQPDVLKGPEYEALEVPKFISVAGVRQVITDEERAAKAGILLENARRHEAACQPIVEWQAAYKTHFDEFTARVAAECGITLKEIEVYERRYGDVVHYRIESIPVMEEMDTFGL